MRPPSASYVPRADLPPHLQSLFNPRPPLPFMKVPIKPKCRSYTGLSEYVDLFEEAPPTDRERPDTGPDGIRPKRPLNAKQQLHSEWQAQAQAAWKPAEYTFQSDPLKTLFVYRLPYDCDERRLRREFEIFGPIKSIALTKDKQGKPRGYAFLEYENEKDFKSKTYSAAYKHGDGLKISNRKVLVDCERGRASKDWKPRFLGGGKGSTRATRQKGERSGEGDFYNESRGYKPPAEQQSRSRSPRRRPEESRRFIARGYDDRRERFRREEAERRPR